MRCTVMHLKIGVKDYHVEVPGHVKVIGRLSISWNIHDAHPLRKRESTCACLHQALVLVSCSCRCIQMLSYLPGMASIWMYTLQLKCSSCNRRHRSRRRVTSSATRRKQRRPPQRRPMLLKHSRRLALRRMQIQIPLARSSLVYKTPLRRQQSWSGHSESMQVTGCRRMSGPSR